MKFSWALFYRIKPRVVGSDFYFEAKNIHVLHSVRLLCLNIVMYRIANIFPICLTDEIMQMNATMVSLVNLVSFIFLCVDSVFFQSNDGKYDHFNQGSMVACLGS